MTELIIFGRFHARTGSEQAVAAAIRTVVAATRSEPECLGIDAFRSLRDASLFFIHSRWPDEAAFDRHAQLAHTRDFLASVEALLTHALDVTRTTRLD
jgi:quinol monooxygenase YgiN